MLSLLVGGGGVISRFRAVGDLDGMEAFSCDRETTKRLRYDSLVLLLWWSFRAYILSAPPDVASRFSVIYRWLLPSHYEGPLCLWTTTGWDLVGDMNMLRPRGDQCAGCWLLDAWCSVSLVDVIRHHIEASLCLDELSNRPDKMELREQIERQASGFQGTTRSHSRIGPAPGSTARRSSSSTASSVGLWHACVANDQRPTTGQRRLEATRRVQATGGLFCAVWVV